MAFRPKTEHQWDLYAIDPNQLSDEQVEFYYKLAQEQGREVESFPLGSMGRYTVASSYLRFRHAQRRRRIRAQEPQF